MDVWDGLFARLLKVESELGVQLDSMADMVTCGVAPGIILAQLFVMAGNKPVEIPLGWPLNAVVEFIPWVFIGFLILWALLLDWLDSIFTALIKIIL